MEDIRSSSINQTSQSRQVKEFYDAFRDERLVRDLRTINIRQEAAIQLVRSNISKNARVLEIGCGIGIVTRALIHRGSFILAIDISEANIELAQRLVRSKKVQFQAFDVVSGDPKWIAEKGPFDIVIMVDAIEHITSGEHQALFARIESWLKAGGLLILTYPSPEYQMFLRKEQPAKLQIIDEVVRLGELISKTKMTPIYYSLKDVWLKGQYVHLVFRKDSPDKLKRVVRGRLWRFTKRCRDQAWRAWNARVLRDLR